MFSLIDLPYKSLAPVISDQTLSFHHGKHLQTYVDNLNKLIVDTEFASLLHSARSEESVLTELVQRASGAIFNNAGQILNHNLYFAQFAPTATPLSDSPLKAQLLKQWGSVEAFQTDFEQKGTSLFGSGWVWLAADNDGALSILQCPNADTPAAHVVPGSTCHFRPLLTFDVWEHAYYLDHQNRRAAHLHSLWSILNWKEIEKRYSK